MYIMIFLINSQLPLVNCDTKNWPFLSWGYQNQMCIGGNPGRKWHLGLQKGGAWLG